MNKFLYFLFLISILSCSKSGYMPIGDFSKKLSTNCVQSNGIYPPWNNCTKNTVSGSEYQEACIYHPELFDLNNRNLILGLRNLSKKSEICLAKINTKMFPEGDSNCMNLSENEFQIFSSSEKFHFKICSDDDKILWMTGSLGEPRTEFYFKF